MTDPLFKLQEACNAVLKNDLDSMEKVKALAGRIVAVEISGPDLIFYVQFSEQGVILMQDFAGNPHLIISAGVATYIGLLLNRDATLSSRTPNMSVSGDVTLAQDFQRIIKGLEIDWEEHISHWVGDTAAHKLGRITRDLREYFREAGNTLSMDVSEYLRHEKDLLPDKTEVDEFINAVDQLRNDVDRFSQQIDHFSNRLSQAD